MNNNQNPRQKKLQSLFIPPNEGSLDTFKEIVPIFLLITLVMVGLFTLNITVGTVDYDPLRLSALTVLFLFHLTLYWMILGFAQTQRGAIQYLIFQGLLVFVIVLVSGNVTLSLGLFSSISGTAVGTLGNKRLALMGVAFYIILAVVNVLLLSDFVILGEMLPMFLGAVAFAAFFAYLFNRQVVARDRAQALLTDLENAHQQLSEYALEVESLTLTHERQRMARELHDTLAQGLAGLILQLEAADTHLGMDHPKMAQDIIQQAMVRARTTLADARRAIDDLRKAPLTSRDLTEALQEEIARFEDTTGIDCHLKLNLLDNLPPLLTENVMRAVSEGLMNIARHARANQVSVELDCVDKMLELEIRDNGTGFDPEKAVGQSGHYGLLGIRERARNLGGSLHIKSKPSQGTTLKLEFPLGVEA